MSAALELNLGDEHEAKFLALKSLHTKKLKSLMSSIDAKDREIAKLKILGKDNRRAQMIQELRKKIRTHETINDIIKEELQKRTETTIEEANNMIIRKTLAGPKRFRPLSREELENKIIDLEKRLAKKTSAAIGKAPPGPPISNGVSGTSGTADAKADSKDDPRTTQLSSSGGGGGTGDKIDDIGKFVAFVDEIDNLRRVIKAKDTQMDAQKEEIIRLRSRNAQLVVVEEDEEFRDKEVEDLRLQNDALQANLDDTTHKLADALEVTMRLKADIMVEEEARRAEVEALHKQNDKYMRQNAQLLASVAQLEVEREKHSNRVMQTKQETTVVTGELQSKNEKIKSLESLSLRLEDKLKETEKKVNSLSKELGQIDILKEALREKNITIKELKRNAEVTSRIKNSGATGAGGTAPSSLGEAIEHAEAKEDNQDTNDNKPAK